MGHHFQGIAVALLLGAGVYAAIWTVRALKRAELRRYRRYIEAYFEKRGEHLVEARWQPLGPGAQAGTDKLFSVTYVDREGREHSASCRSGASGVHLADDELTGD